MTTLAKKSFYTVLAFLLFGLPELVQAVRAVLPSSKPDCGTTAQGDLTIDCNKAVPVPRNRLFSGLAGAGSFSELVLAIIQILLIIVAAISVLFLIIGGFRYVTAHGNEEQAEGAKKTIIHAILGIAIVLLAFAIISIIINIIVEGQL